MRNNKVFAMLLSLVLALSCIGALTFPASADGITPVVLYTVAGGNIANNVGNGTYETLLDTGVTDYQFIRVTPQNKSVQTYVDRWSLNITPPASHYWVKALMRTNETVTPIFRTNQNGTWTTETATAVLTGDEAWHEIYFELTLPSENKLTQFHFRILGNALPSSFYSGDTTDVYMDLAAFGIFSSEADAIAYDFDPFCKVEAANAVFVSASGDDNNSGRSSSYPVATLSKARTIASGNASVDTIYIIGTITTTAAETLGVSSKTVSYLGYPGSDPHLNAAAGAITLNGSVIFDDMQFTARNSDGAIRAGLHSVTLGSNLTGSSNIAARNIASAYYNTQNGNLATPTVITVNNATLERYYPAFTGATFNGAVTLNVGSAGRISGPVIGGHGYGNSTQNMNGIVRVNAAAGSQITTIIMAANASGGITNFKGLRYLTLDGTVTNLYLAGSSANAASSANTGVAVFEFGPNAVVSNLNANGAAGETGVTRVLIFNDNPNADTYAATAASKDSDAIILKVTGGSVSAVTTGPASTSDLTCTLDGFRATSTYRYMHIDGVYSVELSTLTDNTYTGPITAGIHTVEFSNVLYATPVVTTTPISAVGVADGAISNLDPSCTYAIRAYDFTGEKSWGDWEVQTGGVSSISGLAAGAYEICVWESGSPASDSGYFEITPDLSAYDEVYYLTYQTLAGAATDGKTIVTAFPVDATENAWKNAEELATANKDVAFVVLDAIGISNAPNTQFSERAFGDVLITGLVPSAEVQYVGKNVKVFVMPNATTTTLQYLHLVKGENWGNEAIIRPHVGKTLTIGTGVVTAENFVEVQKMIVGGAYTVIIDSPDFTAMPLATTTNYGGGSYTTGDTPVRFILRQTGSKTQVRAARQIENQSTYSAFETVLDGATIDQYYGGVQSTKAFTYEGYAKLTINSGSVATLYVNSNSGTSEHEETINSASIVVMNGGSIGWFGLGACATTSANSPASSMIILNGVADTAANVTKADGKAAWLVTCADGGLDGIVGVPGSANPYAGYKVDDRASIRVTGVQFTTTKNFVSINSEAPVSIETFRQSDDRYIIPVSALNDGGVENTVEFTDNAFSDSLITKAGYVADTEDAAAKTYAIIASVQIADWIDVNDISSIGFYGYTAESETAKVTLAVNATIQSDLTSENKRFYAVIDEIPDAATSVVLKPFVVLNGTATCAGAATAYVPQTIGASTYYGTQDEIDAYFAD